MDDVEVLVVGAGPTGLALACDLAQRDVRVAVVEQREQPSTTSRAFALHPRGLEILEDVGAGAIVRRTTPVTGVTTHVAGHPLTRVRLGGLARHGHPGIYLVSQADVEAQLRERLDELGVPVRFGCRLDAVEDGDGDQLVARLHLSESGTSDVRAAWVVGCDGAHSTVRELARIPFQGDTFEESFLLADLRLQWPFDEREIATFLHHDGVAGLFPLPEPGLWRLVAQSDEVATPPDDEAELVSITEPLLRERTGRDDLQVTGATWWSRFRIHRRLAARYRTGRLIIAGDAAHVHSPFGGQGMNVGLGDAHNLGWKLATVVRGQAGDALLDSYAHERRAVAREVVDLTSTATRVAVGQHAATRLLRDRVLPALARASSDRPTAALAPPAIVLERFAQLRIRYRDGALAAPPPTTSRLAAALRGTPIAGDRAPDAPVTVHHDDEAPQRTTLRSLTASGWALLRFGPPSPEHEDVAAAIADHLDDLPILRVLPPSATLRPSRWRGADRIEAPSVEGHHGVPSAATAATTPAEVLVEDHGRLLTRAYRPRGSESLLLRPDGHIGWRSVGSPPLATWLRRAFGGRPPG